VNVECYQAGKQLYIKEICLIELNGQVYDHRFVIIPKAAQINDRTNNYIFHQIHGIPFNTKLDKKLPRIAAKSTLITHGIEKARMLQRLYPHCNVLSKLHEKRLSSTIGHSRLVLNFY
jgi:hypothetical protein